MYPYPSTLHITVKGIGLLDEQFSKEELGTIFRSIERIVSEFRPFQIDLRGLAAFPTSIYITVNDKSGQLGMMNKRISEELKNEIDVSAYDGDSYIPHVTIASFNTKNVSGLLDRIEQTDLRNYDFGTTSIFETEAVQVKMYLALRSGEAQECAFGYIMSFHLG